jgi:hypothetical protein
MTGLYIGLHHLMRRPPGRFSLYEGCNLWHHLAGLVFGVFTLTWVLSGLLSMNPWGWLEGGGAARERELLRGSHGISGAEMRAVLDALAAARLSGAVSIKMAPFNGHAYFVASGADGTRQRLNLNGVPTPLSEADLAYAAGALGETSGIGRLELLNREDEYYFGHHRDAAPLPVYRIVLPDDSATRYYIDPVSGELLGKIDPGARGYRWLHQGLHRLDFSASMRARPRWDILMLLLMSGVTMVCVTGTCLGCRRLLR